MRSSIMITQVLAFLSLCGLLQLNCTSRADAQPLPADRTEAPAASQLVGTIVSGPLTGAVFDDGNGNQSFYRIRERLPDGSQIIKIGNETILVKRSDGEVSEMFITGGKGHTVTSSAPPNPAPALQQQYQRPPQIAPQAPPAPLEPVRRRGRTSRQRTPGGDE